MSYYPSYYPSLHGGKVFKDKMALLVLEPINLASSINIPKFVGQSGVWLSWLDLGHTSPRLPSVQSIQYPATTRWRDDPAAVHGCQECCPGLWGDSPC